MRHLRYSTCLVVGLAVMLALIPSGRALAIGILNADFFWERLIVVEGQPVQFYDDSNGSPIFWHWDFDDGTTSNLPNPTHTFSHKGDYNVELTVWENDGDFSDHSEKIEVFEYQQPSPPTAGFSFWPSSPAVNQPVFFDDTSVGNPHSWVWQFDDGEGSSGRSPTHAFAEAGTYLVILTVTNVAGTDDEVHPVTVFGEFQAPEASFFFLPTNPTVGQFVNFFDNSGGGSVDSTEQYPGHQYDSEGAYDVSLTVTNSAGETSTVQTVNVGAEIPPIDPDFDNVYFVPSASHAAGAAGSFWVTDMDVNNAGDDTATYKLAWLARKADNSNPAKSEEFTLEPGEAVRFDDVVLSVFDIVDGFGALAVVSDSRDLFIFSRTYNDADIGTFGTAVPGVNEKDLIEDSTRKRLLFFTEDGGFRSNIAFQNGIGSNLRVKWERFLADGTLVESGTTDLKPYSNTQLNAVYKNEAPAEAAYMDVWTDDVGGKFMVFSSVIDNGTSDGTVVQPQW